MSTASRVRSIGRLSRRWLREDFVFRRRALQKLEKRSGFSKKMAAAMIDAVFSEWTETGLRGLLRSELKDPAALDGFVREGGRLVRARGPRTVLHVLPGNVPGAAVASLAVGLLLGSHNILKVSGRDEGILPDYLDSLKAHDRSLWRLCRLERRRSAVRPAAGEADLVVAYGEDATLKKVRSMLPAKVPFIGHGHRVSVSLLLKGSLTDRAASRTALDVWMADQRGCLSPVLVFAQKGGGMSAAVFAEKIAEGLGALEKGDSKPRRGLEQALARRRFADRVKIEALKGGHGCAWQSVSGNWMVVYDERSDAEFASGSQVIRVKGFSKLSGLEPVLGRFRGSLQAASLECKPAQRRITAEWLSGFGISRVCRAGQMQKPPVVWHHDGRLNLASWLSWTDLEA